MDLYAEHILDHYRVPRGKGELHSATVSHTEKNLSCGDVITLQLQIEDGTIAACAWQGEGCAISQAAMSMLMETLPSMKTADIAVMTPQSMIEKLGVPIGPRRYKCALLALHTLQNALRLDRDAPMFSWAETMEELAKTSKQ